MPQQINLYTPTQYVAAQRFTAQSLLNALLIVLLATAGLAAVLSWSMARSGAAYRQSLAEQEREIQELNQSLDTARSNAGPPDANLKRQLQELQTEVTQRSALLTIAQHGTVQPGLGHSDRLLLVARSIPPQAWITGLKADADMMEVSGFTLEPAALNDWVRRLAQSPLMQGLQLASVKVEIAADALSGLRGTASPGSLASPVAPAVPVTTGPISVEGLLKAATGANAALGQAPQVSQERPASVPAGRQVWSFTLLAAQQSAAPAAGEKP